ncbi:FUSC family protein [Advenella sp. WQ 585]|uniref:FUSC family protein n=1 Tax=Advenella mandrilli TaxID=2800330 RepID=A0ABS1ECE9_9BURK|nr:FUSC family protein [Advenella mandrilli]MBK1781266.1 FUSC family protein [Advenella mandrilli]
MTTTAKRFWPVVLNTAKHDLRPFDGRLAMAWRVAAQCALAAFVFMTYGIPLAAIGCYLILFLMKPDSAENTLMAIGLTVLVALVVVMLLYLVRWTIDDPMWRIVVIAVGSFIFLYLGAASQLGEIGSVLALVVAFAMTLLGDVPFGEAATRALLYAWLMTVTPMGIIVLFNLFLGRSAVRLLKSELGQRLEMVGRVLEQATAADDLHALLNEGNEALKKRAGNIKLLHLVSTAQTRYLNVAIDESYRLMLAVVTLAGSIPEQQRAELAAQCRLAAQAVAEGCPPGTPSEYTNTYGTGPAEAARQALDTLLGRCALPVVQAPKVSFFFKDALTNPNYVRFALKTTAAAIISYLVYEAIDWQGIHTAMITCYVAALGTTAETVHKLTLRIIGCLIGAAMGVASILFLIPHMTSIGSLMALVFAGILVAGWVSSGSERIAYAGIQIGLAFLLTVLQGFGPDIEMSAASDRVVGILLGNLVMYLVFTRVWPLAIATTVNDKLSDALDGLTQILGADSTRPATMDQVSKVVATLHQAREALGLSMFEPRNLRQDDETILRLKTLIARADALCPVIAFKPAGTSSTSARALNEINQMKQLLSQSQG